MNIMAFFHTCNNTTQPPVHDHIHDPAYKVNHFSKMLIRNWKHVYTPAREVSIDEYLLLLFATTRSVFKSVKISVVEIAKRTN